MKYPDTIAPDFSARDALPGVDQLQARQMGLYTHGMGGIKHEEAASYLKLDDDHKVVCGFAIGVAAAPDTLPDELVAKVKPSPRKPLSDVLRK